MSYNSERAAKFADEIKASIPLSISFLAGGFSDEDIHLSKEEATKGAAHPLPYRPTNIDSLNFRLREAAVKSDENPYEFFFLLLPALYLTTSEDAQKIITEVLENHGFLQELLQKNSYFDFAPDKMALLLNGEEIVRFNESEQRRFFALQFLLAHEEKIPLAHFRSFLINLEKQINGNLPPRTDNNGLLARLDRLTDLLEPLPIISLREDTTEILVDQEIEHHIPFKLVSLVESFARGEESPCPDNAYLSIFGLNLPLKERSYHFFHILAQESAKNTGEGWITQEAVVTNFGGKLKRPINTKKGIEIAFQETKTAVCSAGFILEEKNDDGVISYRLNQKLEAVAPDGSIQTNIPTPIQIQAEVQPQLKVENSAQPSTVERKLPPRREAVVLFNSLFHWLEKHRAGRAPERVELIQVQREYLPIMEYILLHQKPISVEDFSKFLRATGKEVSLEEAKNIAVEMAKDLRDTESLKNLFRMTVDADGIQIEPLALEPLFIYDLGINAETHKPTLMFQRHHISLSNPVYRFLNQLTFRRNTNRFFAPNEIIQGLSTKNAKGLIKEFRNICLAANLPAAAELIIFEEKDERFWCRINPRCGLSSDIPEGNRPGGDQTAKLHP